MYFRELFHLFLKYAIFGAIIFLVVYKVPTNAVNQHDNIVITLVSVAVFVLLEMFGGYLKKLKDLLCGCSSSNNDNISIDPSLVI
jgi:hypothetical protein